MVVVLWILMVVFVAIWASNKEVSVGTTLLISIFFTPLFGAMYVALKAPEGESNTFGKGVKG